MDLQSLFTALLPLVLIAVGWFMKEIWAAVQILKLEVHDIRTHMAENYVHKNDFADRWEEILKAVHRIEDKLDNLSK